MAAATSRGGNVQAKMPLLSGNPARQGNRQMLRNDMKPKGMPLMSPGKPRKSIVGKPASVPVNKAAKQPKGKGSTAVTSSSIKGAPRRSANALNGRQSRGGRINSADMGI